MFIRTWTITMDLTARQQQIADAVQSKGYVTVEHLAESFGVTTQTIRRDLQRLSDLGVLRRRHGGVEVPSIASNLPYPQRQVLNLREKRQIGRAVAAFIPNGASLAFSIGTTPEAVAQALSNHQGLHVFTNNVNVAAVACGNPTFRVTISGGLLRNEDLDVLGPSAEDFFSSYKVDFGIFGVGGVDADGSLLDFTEDEVRVRQAIRRNCRQSLLVLDHTKFSRPAHVRGGFIHEMSLVFCDRDPPPAIRQRLAQTGTQIIIAAEETKA